jgi:hypothetical protein
MATDEATRARNAALSDSRDLEGLPRLLVMEIGPDGRRRVDLTRLPRWTQMLLGLGIALVVAGIALAAGRPAESARWPISAVLAGVIAFAFVAWRAQHPRR